MKPSHIRLGEVYGWDKLSDEFCNHPVEVVTFWNDEFVAAVLLCGRLSNHEGDHDPVPPLSDIQ